MARPMTAKQRAALRKAQLASARKRRRGSKKSRRRKNLRRAAVAGGVAVAVGGGVYAVHKNKASIKKKKDAAKRRAKARIAQKAKNNHAARTATVGHLRKEVAKKRKPVKGLKMGKKYRMGRPDVRKKRKARRG